MITYSKLQEKARSYFPWAARSALALIYIWFGLLKLLGLSPAEQLVQGLFERAIHFLPFGAFYASFAVFEIIIGVLFLWPRLTRLAFILFALHMVATLLPLFFLPELSWQSFLVPTLTGQYIIKNVALIACALGVIGFGKLSPLAPRQG